MKVLMVSTDRNVLRAGTSVRARAEKYSHLFDELHIIVNTKNDVAEREVKIAPNTWIYPTRSRSRLFYGIDAYTIARDLPHVDVVTAQDPFETGLAAYCIARGRGAKFHVQLHTDPFAPYFVQVSFLNRIRRAIAPFVLKRADRIRVVARHLKENIERVYGIHTPVSVLPIFVDVARFKTIERRRHERFETSLVWTGRFEGEKNPARAITALAKIRNEGCNAGLTMIGAGNLEEKLRALTKRLGVEAFVEFPGWRDPYPYLETADLALVTSEYEGYGIVVVEALSAGVPVLSTDVGIARDAGATIAGLDFAESLLFWVREGERIGVLKYNPYANEADYLGKFKRDLESTLENAYSPEHG